MGYNVHTNDYRTSGCPLPSYPPVQLPQYPTILRQGYGQQIPAFPLDARSPQVAYTANRNGSTQNGNGQQQYSSHGYSPSLPTIQAPLPAPQNHTSFQTNAHAGQPLLMGPPIRMGFDAKPIGHQTQQHAQPTANGTNAHQHGLSNGHDSPYRHSSPMSFPSGRHESPNPFPGYRGRGQKRGHGEVFHRPRNQNHRIQVAPAVPSFGGPLPLPIKPPALHETTRKPRKKKRKHNQLGLTPKAEEHESSEEEEDDADEEARLAAVAASTGQGPQLLQFDFKGRTSTLQSSSDITAWIEERKKKFPTKARAEEIAEGKRQREEQQRATNQVRREAQEKHRTEVNERRKQTTEGEKQRKKSETTSKDAAAKSKRKVEKLRKQLEKEERRIAKAEAKTSKDQVEFSREMGRTDMSALGNESKKRKRSDSGGSCSAKIEDTDLVKTELQETASIVPDPLTPTSQPALADEERDPPPKALNADSAPDQANPSNGQEGDGHSFPGMDRSIQDSSVSSSDSSCDSSSTVSEDITSSSGSSSDDASDDGAPDETSTKRNGPERVAPPKRAKPKQICREFLHKGLCKRGSRCKYLHGLPERASHKAGSQEVRRNEGRKERVGLYQRLVEQEKEQEDRNIMEAILHLGEKGLLEKCVQAVNGDEKAS
ncbi:hypothetical protein HO173_005333 [Letharia columbiana]|uniref:C3H1-type domain-containing protein n=1 Tax=Letharia columbiana TaxID=112416 RepID=A0A8H6L5M9_9LECA|nr:uncharacterized protein HO173_005333 [Letharia columbiana]KAF6236552.1 hypothetical protein HO173_005333 [Letharia columbiana]